MKKETVRHPDRQVSTGAYNDGVQVGPWLFVSGCGPRDLATNAILGTTVEEQTAATLGRIEAVLGAAGLGLEHVVKCTAYLRDMGDFEAFDRVYAGAFPDPKPARTTVSASLRGGILVQMDAIAFRG